MGRLHAVNRVQLPRISDRISFLYLDHCVVSRNKGALTATTNEGVLYIPVATIGVLMLGPGTSITHRAIALLGECGTSTVWVGEYGIRYYGHGRSLADSSELAAAQARAATNKNIRVQVARKMYAQRFGAEGIEHASLQQLRGKEGTRMNRLYRRLAQEYRVEWKGRHYDPSDFGKSDPVNAAISSANACLYGVCHAVICSLGCYPSLGIIHSGHALSFVYDIADLYKAETSLPLAFATAADDPENIAERTRKKMAEHFHKKSLIPTIVQDLFALFDQEETVKAQVLHLWDYQHGEVPAGTNWEFQWHS